MPRNMVIGKLKYLIGPASGLYSHLLWTSFLMRAHAGAESSYSVVEDGDPDPQPGKKGEKSCGWLGSHTCVLGLPGQVNKFDSNRPLLTVWDCLTLLPHRVRSERWWWWIWLVGWWKIIVSHHVCYWIDAHLEWVIELEPENYNLQLRINSLLLFGK